MTDEERQRELQKRFPWWHIWQVHVGCWLALYHRRADPRWAISPMRVEIECEDLEKLAAMIEALENRT